MTILFKQGCLATKIQQDLRWVMGCELGGVKVKIGKSVISLLLVVGKTVC
jgi:hypothetical protein